MAEPRNFNLTKLKVAFDGKEAGVFQRLNVMIYRARVPGGWLVLTGGSAGMSGVTFYPDPRHEWDGGTED